MNLTITNHGYQIERREEIPVILNFFAPIVGKMC